MRTYNIHDAKTNLSRLIEQAVVGHEAFIIAKAGKPLVKVTPLEEESVSKPRRIGFLKGQIVVPNDFDSMDSEAIADLFEGKSE